MLKTSKVTEILKRYGHKRGQLILLDLARKDRFVEALDTEVGKELLSDAIDRLDFLLSKIIHEESTERDRAEYRVLKQIVEKWGNRVESYLETINKINGGVK